MQHLTAPMTSNGAFLNFLQAATEPVGGMDSTIPVRSDYSLPHPPPQRSPNKRRDSPRQQAEIPAEPKDDGHVIDDYA